MNRLFFSSLCLLLATRAAASPDFIRQIQTLNGNTVVYDIPVSGDEGEVLSKPLGADVAVFQLFTTVTDESENSRLLMLDEKTVGTFLPEVTVQALSEDPHVPARTRADRPYGMRVTVSGMREGDDVPEYAKSVQVVRGYELYDPSTYTPTGQTGEYEDSFDFRRNGVFTDIGIVQRMPADRPTKAVGEESFSAYIHPDALAAEGRLAKASVQIWPVAEAVITGIEEGKVYNDVPKLGSVSLRDLYPESTTYAQVYKGGEKLGTEGLPLADTVVKFDSTVPQNQLLPLGGLEQVVDEDGEYTVEILTITPFNNRAPERLAHVSFFLKRSIRVHASMNNME